MTAQALPHRKPQFQSAQQVCQAVASPGLKGGRGK
jgi:hypothetical protein